MGHRLSKIYTRTGDSGTTNLGDGSRVAKDSLRVEVYGCVDELNSHLGLLLTSPLPEQMAACLSALQHMLFDLGSELVVPGMNRISPEHVSWLERTLDYYNADLPPLKEFVLPGGNGPAAQCHVARTVCRRCERVLVALGREEPIGPATLPFLNRLSDLLFVLCRVLARRDGGKEVLWERGRGIPEFPPE